jgi:prepilin-type N-terminal cleavage/methylation domain-containing protein
MRFLPKNSKGFSLMEVLISVFIFSIIMVVVMTYFVNVTLANQNTKRLQQNLEDVRFAMNRIAKVLRTSVVISPNSNQTVGEIRVFDYSQARCIRYRFEENGIREYSVDLPVGTADEKVWCAGSPTFASNDIVSTSNGATLDGKFAVVPSNKTSPNETAGRVTMNATITRQTNSSTIQTTVSLRNYKEVSP